MKPGFPAGGEAITVLIPARNEAERIGETVKAVREVGPAWEVIVIDDCSQDATADRAREAGAKVLSLNRHLGKGGALNYGLAESRGEIVLLLDADLGRSAVQCTFLLQPVLDGQLDMAIARFPPPRRRGGFGLVKGLARWGIRLLTGLEMASPLSGQRAVRRQVLEAVGGFADGFGAEVALTIDAARGGFRIGEVPVEMWHAETGRDLAGFWHRGKQFCQVARSLWPRLWGSLWKRRGEGRR